ncbi:MAG: antibiotic biosynthesis monooxygenase [Thermoleophilia bacterium]|jgi:quinol monooxygenase YgiN
MPYYVIIEHNLKGGSRERFETVFKKDAERRKSLGCMGGKVLCDLADPDSILVVFEWESEEGALAFLSAEETDRAFLWASSSASSRGRATEELFVTES